MTKISRTEKVLKVFKRKYTKPLFYACLISLFLYLLIGNIITQKKLSDFDKPHFVITRVSRNFDKVEYMHLLLTIQEIRKNNDLTEKLIYFVNGPFPAYCPKDLRKELYLMNWEAQAFLVRVKKMFDMHQVFEQVSRKDEAIEYLSNNTNNSEAISYEIRTQIKILTDERNSLIKNKLSEEELLFIKEFDYLVASLIAN